jgi:hypothetical protein
MNVIDNLKIIKDKKIRQQALHNIFIQCDNKSIYEQCSNDLYDALNSFYWDKTEQGFAYWGFMHYNSKNL